jgi:CRISPR system Cascade subunit CasD
MSTLLLRLVGPMQSWGTQSRFSIRDTGLEPSKSGVIGLLCAALGKPRVEQTSDGLPTLTQLTALKMGVRVDRPGTLRMDYQTAGGTHRIDDNYGVAHADASQPSTVTSRRYYVADADFLVGLGGDIRLLRVLDLAVAQPRWQIFLGRKSFPPSSPVRLPDVLPWGPGLRVGGLAEVLAEYPWLGDFTRSRRELRPSSLRLVIDSAQPTDEVRTDSPLSFAERRFAIRYVKTQWMELV